MNNEDTIVSIATPMGTGAISVIRCSGSNVTEIMQYFLKEELAPRRAYYVDFKNKEIILDDVIAIFYKAPQSYTGEDMLEIMCHGGPVVYQLIIDEILMLKSCRLAKAGEFSERAFLNNKISLFEAESICALINAKTKAAALAARESLSGKMTNDLFKIDQILLKIRIQVEALLDFSDEDIETEDIKLISKKIDNCKKEIKNIIEKLENNRLLFETSKMTVIGKPNTGKSSLINFLTDDDVSIVNQEAGTTRDVVSKLFSLNGMPITIYDTAGIRKTDDLIEKEGVDRALKQAALSNIVLYLYDACNGFDQNDKDIIENIREVNTNILLIANKVDLIEKNENKRSTNANEEKLMISVKEKININELKDRIQSLLKFSVKNSSPGIYNIKNLQHLNKALEEISTVKVSLSELELIAEKLKIAQRNIAMLLDNEDDDRVLSGIFSNFCIGK